ncbi:hypothetical protein FB45DRAFT_874956 [Roridomyces roridus]|uniref:Uncharacterized protein n=1 Tax=Roridomyces roridus TaxID=1738132 RepID=A0AAD7B800_9AGAR|nr:hypothetical protein FB45DRAFT_874956 [Roridomyces roridus]
MNFFALFALVLSQQLATAAAAKPRPDPEITIPVPEGTQAILAQFPLGSPPLVKMAINSTFTTISLKPISKGTILTLNTTIPIPVHTTSIDIVLHNDNPGDPEVIIDIEPEKIDVTINGVDGNTEVDIFI